MKIVAYGLKSETEFIINSGLLENIELTAVTDIDIPDNAFVESRSGKKYPAVPVSRLSETEYDYMVISDADRIHIKNLDIPEDKIINLFQLKHIFVLSFLNEKYKDTNDESIKKHISYIAQNGYSVFNNDFTNKKCYINNPCIMDESNGLYYTFYCGKKMYMNRNFKTPEQVSSYLAGIKYEQDVDSPHCYFSEYFFVNDNDIVIDAGVAEGNFALSIIDHIKKIYLIECDQYWLEALKYTFEPYMDKVTIIPKFLSDKNNNQNITIDKIAEGEKIDVIKMDIEGAEISALIGAKETISNNSDIRIAACCYHKHNDEHLIKAILESYKLKTTFSNQYMLFIWDNEFFKYPEFRHGLIWTVPDKAQFSETNLSVPDEIKNHNQTNYLYIPDFRDNQCKYETIIEEYCRNHNGDNSQLIIYTNEKTNNNEILSWYLIDILENYSDYNVSINIVDGSKVLLNDLLKYTNRIVN